MDEKTLRRMAEALGDTPVFDKHQTGEVLTIRLRDLLEDVRSFDPISVDDVLMELAKRAAAAQ